MRLVCVGDSFTEGLSDELRPDGEYLGWADRVASALAETEDVEYANLAVRGKLLDQVVQEQVPVAETLAPDVLTFHAGGNDVLRRGADLPALLSRYNDAVAGITSSNREVLLFTCITRAGGSGRLARGSRRGSDVGAGLLRPVDLAAAAWGLQRGRTGGQGSGPVGRHCGAEPPRVRSASVRSASR